MKKFTIIVEVRARNQAEAFRLVEDAIEEKLTRDNPQIEDDTIAEISTPDGTHSVLF